MQHVYKRTRKVKDPFEKQRPTRMQTEDGGERSRSESSCTRGDRRPCPEMKPLPETCFGGCRAGTAAGKSRQTKWMATRGKKGVLARPRTPRALSLSEHLQDPRVPLAARLDLVVPFVSQTASPPPPPHCCSRMRYNEAIPESTLPSLWVPRVDSHCSLAPLADNGRRMRAPLLFSPDSTTTG